MISTYRPRMITISTYRPIDITQEKNERNISSILFIRAGTNIKFSLRTFGNKIFEWVEASVIHRSCAHTCMSCLFFIFPIPFGRFISILLA